jgi:phosphate transport system protein
MNGKNLVLQLQELHDGILRMGVLVQEGLRKALFALEMHDYDLAREVIVGDAAIDEMERSLDELTVAIVQYQHPVAVDLRELLSTAKITGAMERIGDHSRFIAEKARTITDPQFSTQLPLIRQMVEINITMLRDFLTAYVERDGIFAREIAARDDQIDVIHKELMQQLVGVMSQHPELVQKGIDLVLVNRLLERLGDQITNMCEWVVYTTDADHVELN